jgi:hypothetical protein
MKKLLASSWAAWKKVARAVGLFNTAVVLTAFYYLCLWPFGLYVRLFRNPFKTNRKGASTAWRPRAPREKTLADVTRQW